jgi:acyl carrier protein
MDRRSAEERLRRIISERLSVDEAEVTRDAAFADDLSADSLEIVELIMSMEEEFGIDTSDDDWLQGAGVPWRGPFPTDSGAAALPLPNDGEAPSEGLQ